MPSAISSSAAVATDQAVQILQNAAAGTGNGSALTLDSRSQFVTLTTSGGIGTVIPEHSFDGGATWETAFVEDLLAGAAALLGSITTAAGIQRYRYRAPPGANRLRTRISAFVSGAITCTAIERRLA
jgi:hypothetical protein